MNKSFKLKSLMLSLVLVIGVAVGSKVGGTVAWIVANTDPVVNTFTQSKTDIKIEEEFNDNIKSSIIVSNPQNDDSIAVYVRINLVSYRVSDDGAAVIGGASSVPSFTLGKDWVKSTDGYYYYTNVVPVGGQTTNLLGSGITLLDYTDEDGGKQVIEVMAEAIQSVPTTAVADAWTGVTVNSDSTLSVAQ